MARKLIMATRKTLTRSTVNPQSRRGVYSAPALEKGLDILQLLAEEPDSISLTEVADRLDRSVGEIFRMLAVLEQRGFVRTSPGSDRYQLSMKLFQLAHSHLPVSRLTRAADAAMRRLALSTGQSCHLTVLSGMRIVVIAKHDSFRDRNFSMRVGAESPIFASCSGRIFYALSDELSRRALLGWMVQVGEDTSAAAETEKRAGKIRRSGLLEIVSETVAGITDLGTPVYDHRGGVAASLVIPFLHRLDNKDAQELNESRRALLEAGREISHALGARTDHK